MGLQNWRPFADVEFLGALSPAHLIGLLHREAADFSSTHGLVIDAERVDLEALGALLTDPRVRPPAGLVDALHHVQEVAESQLLEPLLQACPSKLLNGRGDVSAADLALALWLHDRPAFIRVHARRLAMSSRLYEMFRGFPAPMPALDDARLGPLVDRLDDWFSRNQRGSGCVRLSHATADDRTWLVVRRGMAMHARAVLDPAGQAARRAERPFRYDLLFYDAARGELGIHTTGPGEREAYRRAIGALVADDDQHFQAADRFTFQPLAELGEDALACDDVRGIEEVSLQEVRYCDGGPDGAETIVRARRDLFATWGAHWRRVEAWSRLVTAVTFLVKFSDSPSPRPVCLERPHIVRCGRVADAELVDEWLLRRGFLVGEVGRA